ncbi:MAG TPA: purine-binding chemotaxis protein CheW, partial [Thermodesulfobium narugense]
MGKDNLTSDVHEIQLVVFKLANEFYGIEISSVQEIIKIQDITRVPKAPDFVEGVINLRGKIVPIVDLRKRFELGQTERTKDTRVIVVETSGNIVGFIVDLVTEIL